MPDDVLLDVRDLHVYYKVYGGVLKVLNGVNFTIGCGEKVGLIGETGSGKTTTMKAILRVLPRNAIIPQGEVMIHGKNALKLGARELAELRGKGLSMIFQDPTSALNPVFTIGQQLLDVIRYSGNASLRSGEAQREAALRALREARLPDADRMLDSYPVQLSGGMRQRVCIAFSIATARELLIADEPTTNLDVTIQDQVLRLIRDLVATKGASMILITHSLGLAREMTDRVYVMYAGNIIETAATSELFENPLHPYTLGLMASIPRLTGGGFAEGIPGRIASYKNPPAGCRFHPRCPHAFGPCKVATPPFFKVSADGHQVACYLYQPAGAALGRPPEQAAIAEGVARLQTQRQAWVSGKQTITVASPEPTPRSTAQVQGGEEILVASKLVKHFQVDRSTKLRKQSATVKAVDGIDFAVRQGECLGLVGESGSGKSTTAYCVAGSYPPTSGELLFKGENIAVPATLRPLALKKEIQIVFQDPGSSLNPRRTIGQILELPLRVHQIVPQGASADKEVARLLDMVELPASYRHVHSAAIGGGERQMVAIARALAPRSSFIILDEPTSALDVSVQGKIINMLMRLQKELNLTYLFITHDLSLMRNVASRIAIMYVGKIAEIAPAAEFFQNPRHPYTQMLLSSIPVLSAAEDALKPKKIRSVGEIPSPVNVPPGCSFNTRCPFKTDQCLTEDPLMREVQPGHLVRCHLV